MKILKFVAFAALSIFLVLSCSQEDELLVNDTSTQVESLGQPANSTVFSRSVTDCGFIPELCSRPFIAVAQHEPAIFTPCCDSLVGGDDPVFSMTVKDGDDIYTVYTLDLFEDSEDYGLNQLLNVTKHVIKYIS